jgi:hypothetical protein
METLAPHEQREAEELAPRVQLALAVLVPAEEDAESEKPVPSAPAPDPGRLVDPFAAAAAAATVWVEVRFAPDADEIRLDLPHRDPNDLYELVKTLYVLHGWNGVDLFYERVQYSLVASVVEILRLPRGEAQAITALVPSSRPLYIPPDHVDLSASAIGALVALAEAARTWPGVIAGLKAVVPVNDLFARSRPAAHTEPWAAARPEVAAYVFADALVALQTARRELAARVTHVLRQTEREATRLIRTTLTDSRAAIFRETIGYFGFSDDTTVAESLSKEANRWTVTDEKSERPKALQAALAQLVPFADEVKRFAALMGGPPSTMRFVDSYLRPARAVFAREVGRRAQGFPVLSQIAVKDVKPASTANRRDLGDIVFPLLKRAYQANRSMRSRAATFGGVANGLSSARRPEEALADAVRRLGEGKSAWSFPKYVERAAARVGATGGDVARKTLADVTAALGARPGKAAEMMAQAAGEMLALGATARFVPKFVPVLNVVVAAWHVSSAVEEFKDRHDEFYCALDPRDALIEAAPSATGLAFQVGTEAVFAFI